jgi:hypothetical protein
MAFESKAKTNERSDAYGRHRKVSYRNRNAQGCIRLLIRNIRRQVNDDGY